MRENWHNLREYQVLRTLLESGTTIAAARRLNMSQSAVSRSLSNLEARVGHPLFDRDGGRLNPTSEAITFNGKLDALFVALDKIGEPEAAEKESLRIIAPPSYAHSLLVSRIASFLVNNSEFYLSLEIGTSDDVISGVLSNDFDLGFTGIEQRRAGLKLTPFRYSKAVCVMPKGHHLSQLEAINPADLHDQRLIAITPRHRRRSQLERLIKDSGGQAQIVAEVGTSVAAIELAKRNLGIAIVNPYPTLAIDDSGLDVRSFESPIRYQSYFATNDQRPVTRATRAFTKYIKNFSLEDKFSKRI